MADVFAALAARALGVAPVVRPFLPPRFASARRPDAVDPPGDEVDPPGDAVDRTGEVEAAVEVPEPLVPEVPAVRGTTNAGARSSSALLPRRPADTGSQPGAGPVRLPGQSPVPVGSPSSQRDPAPAAPGRPGEPDPAVADAQEQGVPVGRTAPQAPPSGTVARPTGQLRAGRVLRRPAPGEDPPSAGRDGAQTTSVRPVEVWVSIGRVEVRTAPHSERTPQPSPAPRPEPRMSLQDYLRRADRR